MATDDPFEMLRKKLEAKKKAGAKRPAQKGRPAARKPSAGQRPPASRPQSSRPSAQGAPQAAKKPGSWLDSFGETPKAKPARPAPTAGGGGAAPGAPKPKKAFKIVRSAWTAEDLERMRNSKETASEGTPSGFKSHRYDSGIDPNRVEARKKASKEPTKRPKGFRSDRADRK